MPSSTNGPEAEADWEVTSDGFYIATRHFLVRRAYCCANRCRNCPYINWRTNPAWQHAPASTIRHTRVSPKALSGARAALALHQQALLTAPEHEQAYHRDMLKHYQHLLEIWD
jgi:Family of unknown function (DUF5522)